VVSKTTQLLLQWCKRESTLDLFNNLARLLYKRLRFYEWRYAETTRGMAKLMEDEKSLDEIKRKSWPQSVNTPTLRSCKSSLSIISDKCVFTAENISTKSLLVTLSWVIQSQHQLLYIKGVISYPILCVLLFILVCYITATQK